MTAPRKRIGWRVWAVGAVCVAAMAGVAIFASRPTNDPRAIWIRANQALEANRLDEVESDIARLTSLRDPTPEDLMLRGQLQIAREQVDEAIATLSRIPKSNPLASMAEYQMGRLELRRRRVRKAEEHYLEAIRLEPDGVRPRRELIYIYGMQSRWKELAAQFRGLAKLGAVKVDDVILWCLTRSVTWRPEEITADLQGWADADPDDRWSRLALAENLSRRQYVDEAEKAVASLPLEDPDVLAFIARLAMERGETDRAEAMLKPGPERHPGLARLRGRLALNRREGEEALRQFRIAHELEPDHRDTLNGLAQALSMLGKAEEAKPFQRLTKDYDALGALIERLAGKAIPRTAAFFKELGAAYEAVGRLEEARAWYGLVIAEDPLDVSAQRSLFRLDRLIETAEADASKSKAR
ncbi:MAG: tetratricopeptide repeat protein [Isosphaeraceae bacterium]|nr:tetratricopeptide repeat protein [Isosphaeraceae bacterium]